MIAVLRSVTLIGGLLGSLPFKAFDEEKDEVPVPLIDNPSPDQTKHEWFETMGIHLGLQGNYYGEKVRDTGGEVIGVIPYQLGQLEAHRGTRTADNPSGKVFVERGKSLERTPREVFHVPLYSTDGVRGLSPIGAAREAIASALSAEEFANRLWSAGGLAQGILWTDAKLDNEKAESIKRRFMAKVSGIRNAFDIAVLDSGLKYEKLSIPPQDLQFLEARGFQVVEIARLYGLPPHLLAHQERQTSWGTGIEQQNIGFVVYTMDPTWFSRIGARVTLDLLRDGGDVPNARPLAPPGVTAEYAVQGLLKGDSRARSSFYQTLYEIRSMTPNEIRDRENLRPYDGGDDFYTGPVTPSTIAEEPEE
jgi:HK97 family phage portal protein